MKFIKKLISFSVALTLTVGALPSMALTSFAANNKDAHLVRLPSASEQNQSGWGYPALDLLGGWNKKASSTDKSFLYALDHKYGTVAYCIEPGVPLNSGDNFVSMDETYWENYPSQFNPTISPIQIKSYLGRILQYGYGGNINNDWNSANSDHAHKMAHTLATQMLVWETIVGERDAYFNHVWGSDHGKNNVTDYIQGHHPLRNLIFDYYATMERQVQQHIKLPSFFSYSSGTASTYELKWDGSKYSTTLTDENKVLTNYTFHSENESIQFHVKGNTLTISTEVAPKGKVSIVANKVDSKRTGVVVWTDGNMGGGHQNLITHTASVTDPIKGVLNVEVRTGNLKLVKTSEDNLVADLSFLIEGNDISEVRKTNEKGVIDVIDLPIGTYTITEQSPDKYVPQATQTVTISRGKTTTFTFHNKLKKFQVTVTKSDTEVEAAQGDGSLSGAVYGLYRGDELIKEYTTDKKGQFTTDYFICGSNWTIRELSPSEGYLLDKTVHKVGAEAASYTIEYNPISLNVTEQVIKGKIGLVKHTDNGDTQIETPEEGAEFEVFLKASGDYTSAKDTEKDLLTIDKDGFATTKSLPYGVYTVKQTKGWEGRELMAPFDVYISTNEETYHYILNNANFESHIKIVKKDSETEKLIPYAGTGFQIYDPTGNLVTMSYAYPTPTTIDTFYTNKEGYLITPESLPYGTGYNLVEVQAPYGYVLDQTPIPFDVIQSESEEESNLTLIKVTQYNTAQKGIISIHKMGELFHSVETSSGVYQPLYGMESLAGAVYEVVAAEDIYTPDGTLRVEAGTLVSTLTTKKDSLTATEPLYLGNYIVTETKAPNGMVLNPTPQEIALTYEGQEIEITEKNLSFYNQRQKATLQLKKSMEVDEVYKLDFANALSDVSFGLFAREDVVANDGSAIPADGLIEVLSINKEGIAQTKTDLPFGKYYMKELTTNDAYLISDAEYDLAFDYQGQDVPMVSLVANEDNAIKNQLLRGRVQLVKTHAELPDTPVVGAVFDLYHDSDSNGKWDEQDRLLATLKEGEDGVHSLEQLPFGSYFIKEQAAPKGFVVDSNAYYFQITEDEMEVIITNSEENGFENAVMRGGLLIQKTSSDNVLEGFTFLVEGQDVFGTAYREEFITNKHGQITILDLIIGDYTVTELKTEASKSYVLPDAQTISILHDDLGILTFHNEKIVTRSYPKTGDDSASMFWLLLAGTSTVVSLSLAICNSKKRKKTTTETEDSTME